MHQAGESGRDETFLCGWRAWDFRTSTEEGWGGFGRQKEAGTVQQLKGLAPSLLQSGDVLCCDEPKTRGGVAMASEGG